MMLEVDADCQCRRPGWHTRTWLIPLPGILEAVGFRFGCLGCRASYFECKVQDVVLRIWDHGLSVDWMWGTRSYVHWNILIQGVLKTSV